MKSVHDDDDDGIIMNVCAHFEFPDFFFFFNQVIIQNLDFPCL